MCIRDRGHHSHLPSGLSPQKKKLFSVVVVALGYYGFLCWAIFFYLDPLYTGYGAFRVTRDIGPLKYISLFVGLLAGLFAFVAIRLRCGRMPTDMVRALKTGLPLFCFAGLVLAGSSYARFSSGIQAVSYTHLDVYKRQPHHQGTRRICQRRGWLHRTDRIRQHQARRHSTQVDGRVAATFAGVASANRFR